MNKLIKLDFKRVFSDKLFLVVCILAVVFAVITPLLYLALFGMMGEMDELTKELLAGQVNAKGQFFAAFSFGNNLGLIAPLLIGIILYKDFSFGTIRNKIITGSSRVSVFLSIFVVCFVVLFGVVLAHALLTLFICLPLFGYQSTPFAMTDFWYFCESLLFQALVYVFVSAFVSHLCMTKKNVGLVIVLYIAIVLGFTMIASILQVAIAMLQLTPDMETVVSVLDFLQRINVFNYSLAIGIGTSYSTTDVLYFVLTPIVLTIAMLGHGIRKFSKIDLK